MLEYEVCSRSLKFMFEFKSQIDFQMECLKLKRAAQVVTILLHLSVCNVTLEFKPLPIKPKVRLRMLFKLMAAAKDSWACFNSNAAFIRHDFSFFF